MKYLTAIEFKALSENEKEEYYELLRNEKNSALTAEQKDKVARAYDEISDFGDASEFANDMKKSAERQRMSDAKYIAEKRKKGALAIFGAVSAVVIIVIAVVICSMM